MTASKYIESFEQKKYDVFEKNELLKDGLLDYQGKTIIEFLLDNDFHNNEMDNFASYSKEWAYYYIKYNILKPVMQCKLEILLSYEKGKKIIDYLLEKIDDNEKIELYHHIQRYDYWQFHMMEDEIIKIYKNHGVILPKIFVSNSFTRNTSPIVSDDIFQEFTRTYIDQDKEIIEYILRIFKKNYQINSGRTTNDMLKLIDYKKQNPEFRIYNSNSIEGGFNPTEKFLKINTVSELIFNHELSHIIFEMCESEKSDQDVKKFDELRQPILKGDYQNKIISYLKRFHESFEKFKVKYHETYRKEIVKKYGSLNEYIKHICVSIIESKSNIIKLSHIDSLPDYYFLDEVDIPDVALEVIKTEEEEYVTYMARHHFASQLVIEDLLDAIYIGDIYDELFDIDCLCGHGIFYYMFDEKLPFNECLANYDAIKKLPNNSGIMNDLRNLIGDEMIMFLDNYLVKNREGNYGR